jgi:hypothetical protein
VEQAPISTVARLLRERNQLFLLHEALAEVERARTLEGRLTILETAIKRIGYARVETHDDFVMPSADHVARRISNSIVLSTNDLLVPLRAVGGTALGSRSRSRRSSRTRGSTRRASGSADAARRSPTSRAR